jgi:hypothetical protein
MGQIAHFFATFCRLWYPISHGVEIVTYDPFTPFASGHADFAAE